MPQNPVIAVDFDNTLVDWLDDDNCVLKKGALQAIIRLKDSGCRIIIHTCRVGIAKKNGDLGQAVDGIRRILDSFGVPYDSIHLGTKVIADAYIDDRAVAFRDDWQRAVEDTELLLNGRKITDD